MYAFVPGLCIFFPIREHIKGGESAGLIPGAYVWAKFLPRVKDVEKQERPQFTELCNSGRYNAINTSYLGMYLT